MNLFADIYAYLLVSCTIRLVFLQKAGMGPRSDETAQECTVTGSKRGIPNAEKATARWVRPCAQRDDITAMSYVSPKRHECGSIECGIC